jgi:glycosyltransferase involved in cell wall biosynthesis
MAVGIPAVVSNTRIDSLYHTEKTVKFFESDNDASLAEAIYALAINPGLRRNIVAGGLKYFSNNNWDTVKPNYLAVIDSLNDYKAVTVEPMKRTV